MTRGLKLSLIVIGAVLAIGFLIIAGIWYKTFGPGLTMLETARILVQDDKFGMRAKDRAIRYGDAILPLLISESRDFKQLNWRNSFWIADVLGRIRTSRSRGMLANLYTRPNRIADLVGAVGLADQGVLPESGTRDLIQIVTTDREPAERQLGMIALGENRSVGAVPCLVEILSERPADYWNHAYACEALARIRFRGAIPALRNCMRSQDFYALPDAFRALLTLGDREAVPLAIARVEPQLKDYNSGYIVKELERVTGRNYGFNQRGWTSWWQSAGRGWQIPDKFQKPYDEQPPIY